MHQSLVLKQVDCFISTRNTLDEKSAPKEIEL
jgi:hypothetical protein